MSELVTNAAFISLHVVVLISHVSFFMQLRIFLTGFTSGVCGGNSIMCISLFPNNAYIAMTL